MQLTLTWCSPRGAQPMVGRPVKRHPQSGGGRAPSQRGGRGGCQVPPGGLGPCAVPTSTPQGQGTSQSHPTGVGHRMRSRFRLATGGPGPGRAEVRHQVLEGFTSLGNRCLQSPGPPPRAAGPWFPSVGEDFLHSGEQGWGTRCFHLLLGGESASWIGLR